MGQSARIQPGPRVAWLLGYGRALTVRAAGVHWQLNARVLALARTRGLWQFETTAGLLRAASIVNAAGARADEVAALAGATAIGITPRRRTAFTFDPPAGLDCRLWPAVIALDESWYIKPDAGLLLGSPANADDTHPHDVVPEELDVALGIHRNEAATTLRIRRPRATWAGLRSFVADGEPVLGFDPHAEGFFWAAALGGYGIQSATAVGALAAALLLRAPVASHDRDRKRPAGCAGIAWGPTISAEFRTRSIGCG
jgi:D-arginine dehydrogenase